MSQDSTALITAQQEQITSLGNYIGQLAAVVGILREEMERAATLAVPLLVEVGTGSSWFDCK